MTLKTSRSGAAVRKRQECAGLASMARHCRAVEALTVFEKHSFSSFL